MSLELGHRPHDMRYSMDEMYNDNFYFNNPVDYMANQNDPCSCIS